MKFKVQRKLHPIEVRRTEYPYLTEPISVFYKINKTHIRLPEGTLVRSITYYGSRGPRQAKFSTDHGQLWFKGYIWTDIPLSEGAKIRYV